MSKAPSEGTASPAPEPKQETATEVAERTAPMSEQTFGEVAMATDETVAMVLRAAIQVRPNGEDAVLSGAMTALVRFGVERQQLARPAERIFVRDAVSYFVRFVQRAAEILLNRPDQPNG